MSPRHTPGSLKSLESLQLRTTRPAPQRAKGLELERGQRNFCLPFNFRHSTNRKSSVINLKTKECSDLRDQNENVVKGTVEAQRGPVGGVGRFLHSLL